MSIPELRRREYPEHVIIGTLAGAATLGLMIPPSLTLIVYGVTINESISKLFFAGILPGLILAVMFMAYVAFMSWFSPSWRPQKEPAMSFRQRVENSRFLIPVVLLIVTVIGSMYLGIATATEAAAFGVIGSLALAASQGSLSLVDLYREPDGGNADLGDDCSYSCRSVILVTGDGLHRPS